MRVTLSNIVVIRLDVGNKRIYVFGVYIPCQAKMGKRMTAIVKQDLDLVIRTHRNPIIILGGDMNQEYSNIQTILEDREFFGRI